jgi:uncharacterized membrane protein YeaQ/YmgE (transglycosylase-associated protein family)
MHIIVALVVGLLVGALAKVVIPGKNPGGLLVTMVLGIAGSFLAGLLGNSLGIYHANDAGPGLIASVSGAVLVLALYRFTRRSPLM